MSAVQVIFFDAAGTLFRVRGSVADIYLRYAEPYGVKRSEPLLAAVRSAFRRAFDDAPPPVFAAADPVTLKECERLWWFDVVHNVWYRVGMFEGFDAYFEDVFHAFDGPLLWEAYPETREALSRLKAQGLELGIVSNFDSRLFNVLRGLDLLGFFDSVTISSLARAAKPAPQIFTAALDKHVCDPQDALHVGDSIRDDWQGARGAGLHAVFLAREGAGGSSASPTIATLDELPAVLATLQA